MVQKKGLIHGVIYINSRSNMVKSFNFSYFYFKIVYDEIAMIKKSPTEMNISSWLFHLAAKKQIIYK